MVRVGRMAIGRRVGFQVIRMIKAVPFSTQEEEEEKTCKGREETGAEPGPVPGAHVGGALHASRPTVIGILEYQELGCRISGSPKYKNQLRGMCWESDLSPMQQGYYPGSVCRGHAVQASRRQRVRKGGTAGSERERDRAEVMQAAPVRQIPSWKVVQLYGCHILGA